MTILLVQGDEAVRQNTAEIFRSGGHEVVVAEDPNHGFKNFYLNQRDLGLVVTGADFGGHSISGIEFASRIVRKSDWPQDRVVVLSNDGDGVVSATESGFHSLSRIDSGLADRLLTIARAFSRGPILTTV